VALVFESWECDKGVTVTMKMNWWTMDVECEVAGIGKDAGYECDKYE
jgi:hypothetical protein